MTNLGYGGAMSYDGGSRCDEGINTHEMKLDEVQCAGQANPKVIRRAAEILHLSFVVTFINIIIMPIALNSIMREDAVFPGAFEGRSTAVKWQQHFSDLKMWGLLEAMDDQFGALKFISTYFAVPKSDGSTARSIFNGRRLSKQFKSPPSVNLCEIPLMLQKSAEIAQKGPVYIGVGDIRHWFHQIPVGKDLRNYFGLRMGASFFRWTCLPMGWAWSPLIAQVSAWMLVLWDPQSSSTSKLDRCGINLELLRHNESPPSFIHLWKDGEKEPVGFVTVYYDNIFFITTEKDIAQRLSSRITKNAKYFQITMKEWKLFTPTQLRLGTPEENSCRIPGDGVNSGEKTSYPNFLGIEFAQEWIQKTKRGHSEVTAAPRAKPIKGMESFAIWFATFSRSSRRQNHLVHHN
jgi:hypothetical protein